MSGTARLVGREFRGSIRNYWFAVNSGVFLLGGVAVALFGQPDVSVLGYRTYARALAGMMQLALFVVPLMALFPAVAALAGERETGTLDYLLAQPVTRGEVFFAKWLGVAAAVLLSLLVGIGAMGAVAVARGVPVALVLTLLGLALLLGIAFVSVGTWIAAGAATQARATSVGLTAWLTLLALGSLGLMAAFVGWGAPPEALEAWAFLNPVEAFRMAMITVLDPSLNVLGPVGADLVERLGRGPLVGLCVLSLSLWAGGAYLLGRRRFARQEI